MVAVRLTTEEEHVAEEERHNRPHDSWEGSVFLQSYSFSEKTRSQNKGCMLFLYTSIEVLRVDEGGRPVR